MRKVHTNGGANISTPNDFIGGFSGDIARRLAQNGFNVNSLRTNGLLRTRDWQDLDGAIVSVAMSRLAGIADLRNLGLVYNLGGLGVLTSEWENESSMSAADVDMGGETDGLEDQVAFTLQGVPIPITHKSYTLNIRRLEAARRMNHPIDTTTAQVAARRVSLKLEDILFNGTTLKNADGYSIYGYTTFPARLRCNIGTAWDESSPTPQDDVIHMIATAAEAGFYGPFNLYVPGNYWAVLQKDYSTYKAGSYLKQLLDLREVADVKVSDVMAATEVVMVQMTADVVDLATGQDITNVEWTSKGGMMVHNKVLAAMAPRLKSTENEDGTTVCGIVHAFESGASSTTS